MDVEQGVLDARVPNLILQPIVENAIRHGITQRAGPGRIEVRARRVDNLLRLQVRDNGPGLACAEGAQRVRGGLGLTNTRARLEQLYGASYGLRMRDFEEGGLEVTLEFPFEASKAATSEHVAEAV
jgi:LytS/YehU family sensor histidine kinase